MYGGCHNHTGYICVLLVLFQSGIRYNYPNTDTEYNYNTLPKLPKQQHHPLHSV